MLQVFIRNKVSRWLIKPPWEIEDLLTSVVFGSCEYTGIEGWGSFLYPFFKTSININNEKLETVFKKFDINNSSIQRIDYEFWPHRNGYNINDVYIDSGEPELILTLTDNNLNKYCVLIEVKLNIGKSNPNKNDKKNVSDQLAKYYCHLKNYAEENRIIPIAVIYITPWIEYPVIEIEESITELKSKLGINDPEIYWLSWRGIVNKVTKHVDNNKPLPDLLINLLKILSNNWGFFYERIGKWNMFLVHEKGKNFVLKIEWKTFEKQNNWNFTNFYKNMDNYELSVKWNFKNK